MGAYLSQPVTKKVSSDGGNEYVTYGDSSMQGWRVSQEDAHNSIPDFLPGCSLFAVYDGHGGHEVAAYTAEVLPAFIREHPLYKEGHVRSGLRRAFLEFDQTLTKQEVIDKLKIIAGRENDSEEEEEDETDKEVDELFQEAHMPLDQLVAKYTAGGGGGGEKPEKPAAGGVSRLKSKEKKKVLSPFLRAKTGSTSSLGSDSECSSSTAAEDGGGSSSSSTSSTDAVIQKDLSAELHEASADTSDPKTEAKDVPSDVKSSTDTSESTVKTESVKENLVQEVTLDKEKTEVGSSDGKATNEAESKTEAQIEEKSAQNGSVGSGDADSTEAPESEDTKSEHESKTTKDSALTDGAGDSKPVINGTKTTENGSGTVTTEPKPTPKKGGKGAKPGSGKSPASAEILKAVSEAQNPQKPTRKMPERVAAEIYRDVLAGARLAKEKGMDEDEAAEEEEEADEDFSMEQSEGIEDEEEEEEEEEDEDGEEEEEEEEEDEEEDSDEAQDENEELEEDDFMMNMKDEPGSDSGCTAVVALLHGRHLYVANIGDSRCVLSRSGRAVDMSADHKPEDEPELQRILKAGGKVTMDGRVNGGLNLSRAFGDHAYKTNSSLPADQQMISASPDVRCVTVEPQDEFMVLACDGIWNSKRSQEVVDFVSERIRERGETQLSKICEELFMECLASNTMGDGTGCDNMTCIIVKFNESLATVQAPPIAPEAEISVPEVSDSNGVPSENKENGAEQLEKKDGSCDDEVVEAADSKEAKCKEEVTGDEVKKAEVKTVAECDTSATAVVRPAEELADQPPGKRQRVD